MKPEKNAFERREARAWMVRMGYSVKEIQDDLRQRSHAQVSLTLSGDRHDRRVLHWLLKKGCPERYLKLPEGLRREAA